MTLPESQAAYSPARRLRQDYLYVCKGNRSRHVRERFPLWPEGLWKDRQPGWKVDLPGVNDNRAPGKMAAIDRGFFHRILPRCV